jgi:putative PIN family toxin of toxin-antitoxin system
MRIVVDTNIVFSAIVNTNGKIARILFQPKSRLNFYTTHLLLDELSVHRSKIGSISGLEEQELDQIIQLITRRIRFINLRLIPSETFQKAENLTRDIDIDDTEFVALAEHAKAKLWTGDKRLIQGLRRKGWNKVLSTEDLLASITKK